MSSAVTDRGWGSNIKPATLKLIARRLLQLNSYSQKETPQMREHLRRDLYAIHWIDIQESL